MQESLNAAESLVVPALCKTFSTDGYKKIIPDTTKLTMQTLVSRKYANSDNPYNPASGMIKTINTYVYNKQVNRGTIRNRIIPSWAGRNFAGQVPIFPICRELIIHRQISLLLGLHQIVHVILESTNGLNSEILTRVPGGNYPPVPRLDLLCDQTVSGGGVLVSG